MDAKPHATFSVVDLDRTATFYQALGFERTAVSDKDQIVFKDSNGPTICLRQAAAEEIRRREESLKMAADEAARTFLSQFAPSRDTLVGRVFVHHCDTVAEVDAFLAKALAAGATLLRAAERHKNRRKTYEAYFADPDGHRWNVVYNWPPRGRRDEKFVVEYRD
jgi:hypothetical protein